MEIRHIYQLPPDVIGQIAAGEVVERPAAAIKELVENSMDAGATAITVDIREGGLASFRVADNGSGIRPEDIKLAFARHATSKIRTAQDLYGVRSLGFRGEALASIAAVSKVQCQTRARGTEGGISVRNEGGVFVEIKEAACPEGTTFTVKDLFYNAPVRRRFLKKPAAETAAVSELMARLILSHPAVSFRFMADGKLIYFSAGDGKLESAVMSVYGVQVLKMMTPIDGSMNGVMVNGLIGVGDAARGNRSHEHFFLNGRAMKSTILSAAVETACRQRLTIGRFPLCILHLTMPFENADVNVHPNKWEVRFQDERAVREAVETIVFEALGKTDESPVIPPLFLESAKSAPPSIAITDHKATAPAATSPKPAALPPSAVSPSGKLSAFSEDGASLPVYSKPIERQNIPLPGGPTRKKNALHDAAQSVLEPRVIQQKKTDPLQTANLAYLPPENVKQTESEIVESRFHDVPLRLIGTVFSTYILLEYGDSLILCDQHAVHERLLYEKFMKETAFAPASQALLIPMAVPLSKSEYAAFEENEEALRQAGFDLSPFGDDTVQMRGVPIILGQPQAQRCLMDALDDLAAGGSTPLSDRTSRVIQMACKHAVKGGERLPDDSVMQLIRDIMEQKLPPTCPHGRPLMMQITHTELDQRFRRIQNRTK